MAKNIAVAYSMKKKAKKYAEGGSVDGSGSRIHNEKGVHKSTHPKPDDSGESLAGEQLRDSNKSKAAGHSGSTSLTLAKEKHKKRLSELKSMKGPHGNYAEGGEVPSKELSFDDKEVPVNGQGGISIQEGPVSKEEADKFAKGTGFYADGGTVEKTPGQAGSGTPMDVQCPSCSHKFSYGGLVDEMPNAFDYVEDNDLVSRAFSKRKAKR